MVSFDRDDGVGAGGHACPRRDAGGRPGLDRHVGRGAGRDVADDAELDRLGLGGAGRVGGPDRVAVHRRVGPRRQRDAAADGLGGDAPEGIGRGDRFRADGLGRGEHRVPRGFDAEQPRGRRRAHEPGSGTAARSGPERDRLVRRRATSRHDRHDRAHDEDRDTDDHRGLVPEREREELDEPVRGRVEQVRARREEDLVEELEELVEGEEPDDAGDHHADRQTDRTAADRPPRRPAIRAPAGSDQDDDRDHGEDPQPAEDGADVGHVRPLAVVQDRLAVHLDREIATEHQVGQDRVGRDAQLVGGVAGPGRRLRAALVEGDPLRAEERDDRDRDDDDRGRETGQHGRGTAAEVVHRVILARLRVDAGRRRGPTRPRASSPGPTSPRW